MVRGFTVDSVYVTSGTETNLKVGAPVRRQARNFFGSCPSTFLALKYN